jgi:hypothetical protein
MDDEAWTCNVASDQRALIFASAVLAAHVGPGDAGYDDVVEELRRHSRYLANLADFLVDQRVWTALGAES